MAQPHEIVSFQVGGFSNWVGTHCWNLDSEYRKSATEKTSPLYRQDKSSSSPRLLCFDLRGRRGSLFADTSGIAETSLSLECWNGKVDTHVSEAHPLNVYLKSGHSLDVALPGDDQRDGNAEEESEEEDVRGHELFSGTSTDFAARARLLLQDFMPKAGDEEELRGMDPAASDAPRISSVVAQAASTEAGVEQGATAEQVDDEGEPREQHAVVVWSDFLEVRLSESSYCEIPLWDVRNGAFSSFSGGDLRHASDALTLEWREEALDRVRRILEDCDCPQGFNMTMDARGGFGGLATCLAHEARDQCRSAAIHASALVDPPNVLPTDSLRPHDGTFGAGRSKRRARRALDQALCVHALLEHSSQLLPLHSTPVPPEEDDGTDREVDDEDDDDETLVAHRSETLMAKSARMGLLLDTLSLPYRFGSSRGAAASAAAASSSSSPATPLLSSTQVSWRGAMGMSDWVGALCPRPDLRVISCFALASSTTMLSTPLSNARLDQLSPWSPSATPASSVVTHWSRVLVGRGVSIHEWSHDRAPCFSFPSPLVLPKSFPRPSATFPPLAQPLAGTPLLAGAPHLLASSSTLGGSEATEAHCSQPVVKSSACVSLGCNNSIGGWLSSLADPLMSSDQAAVSARREYNINYDDATAFSQELMQLADSYSE